MRRLISPLAPITLALIATTSLVACGSSSDSASTASPAAATSPATSPESTPASTPESTPATTAAASATDTPPPSADATPAGTTLALGQPAIIDYTDSSKPANRGKITVTVKSITKGSMSDFANVQLDAKDKASTPYYVKVEVKNSGTTKLDGSNPVISLSGVDDRDQRQNSLIMMGTFDKCSEDTNPKSFGPGASYDACQIYLIPGGGSVKGAVWTMYDAKTSKSDINWKG
jgi:hypothetical protein